MKIIKNVNLWDFWFDGHWVVITTNVIVKKSGEAVLGAGIALEAAKRNPELPKRYGNFLKNALDKTVPVLYEDLKLVMFPTKIDWRDFSKLDLIERNAMILVDRMLELDNPAVYCPPFGCGMGRLNWPDVERVVSPILGDNFTVILRD